MSMMLRQMTAVTLFEGNLTPILGGYTKYERIKGLSKTGDGEAKMWISQLKDLGLDTRAKVAAHVTAGCTDGAPFAAVSYKVSLSIWE